MVIRSSTARIIGNILSGNGRNGLTVQQASHADVAGNIINGNGEHGFVWWELWSEPRGLCDACVRAAEYDRGTERGIWDPLRDRRLH